MPISPETMSLLRKTAPDVAKQIEAKKIKETPYGEHVSIKRGVEAYERRRSSSVQPSATKKVEVLSPSEFQQETVTLEKQRAASIFITASNIRELEAQSRRISAADPTTRFIVDGQDLSKAEAQRFVQRQLSKQHETRYQLHETGSVVVPTGEWDPDTRIIKTVTSEKTKVDVAFPYEGAEYYGAYQKVKHDPTVGVAGFFAPTDILGVATSFYGLTGDKRKEEQKRIEAFAYFRRGQEAWKQDKGWEHFGGYIVSSPLVQLGSLPAIAMTGGAGYSLLAGKLAFKSVTIAGKTFAATSLLKGVGAVGGAALITPSVYDIGKEWQSGRRGEAFAKGYFLGASVLIGAKSFRMGQQIKITGSFGLKPSKALDILGKVKQTYPFTQMSKYRAANLDIRIAKGVLRQPGMKTSIKAFMGIEKYGLPEIQKPFLLESGRIIGQGRIGFSFRKGLHRGPDTMGFLSRYQEGVTTFEQVMGKRPDPFMSYKGRGVFGGYETSWSFYQQSLLDPVYGIIGTKAVPKFGSLGKEFTTSKIKIELKTKIKPSGLKYYKPSDIPGTIDYGYTPRGGGIGVTDGLRTLTLEQPVKIKYTTGRLGKVGKYTVEDLQRLEFLEYGTKTPSTYWKDIRPGGKIFEQIPMVKTGGLKDAFVSRIDLFKPVITVGVAPAISFTSKSVSGLLLDQKPETIQQKTSYFDVVQKQDLGFTPISDEMLGLGSIQQLQKLQKTQTMQVPKLTQITKTKTTTPVVTIQQPRFFDFDDFIPTEPIRYTPLYMPTAGLYGRGSRGYGFNLFGKELKYRGRKYEFKIGDLL